MSRGGRILLLEPDKVLAGQISQILRHGGHRIDWQVDPQAAIFSTDTGPPDVIILDLILAGRSGIEFLYELRSYPDWSNLPVIVFSDLPPGDLTQSIDSLNELNIKAFHRKSTTSLAQLAQTVNELLQPAKV